MSRWSNFQELLEERMSSLLEWNFKWWLYMKMAAWHGHGTAWGGWDGVSGAFNS